MRLDYILLIDDDKPTNFINQRIIASTGIDTHIQVCEEGIQALEYLSQKDISNQSGIILLDINMPGMSGWEFLDEYEKLPTENRRNAVLAMLSTSVNPDDEKMARQRSSVDTFISKPLKVEHINDLIEKYLLQKKY